MTDVRRAVTAPLAANEGLWRESDVVRMIRARCADYLCFGPHLVGSIRRFVALMHLGDLEGMQLCKHSRGELGICASAAHQVMLAAPNACLGQQQNAGRLSGDVVRTRIPITDEPDWGTIEFPASAWKSTRTGSAPTTRTSCAASTSPHSAISEGSGARPGGPLARDLGMLCGAGSLPPRRSGLALAVEVSRGLRDRAA